MTTYDYRKAVKEDAKAAALGWLEWEQVDPSEALAHYDSIYDALWVDDSVTGNASGSYWYSAYMAEEALCHNLDMLGEALNEWGMEGEALARITESAESADVTIRCYLLGEVLGEVLGEIEEEAEEATA